MKRMPSRLAALALAAWWLPAAAADVPAWQFSLRSERHADALALRDFGDDAERRLNPRRSDNLAWIDDEARLGRRDGDWTWSVLARARATLVANRDALDLVEQIAQRRTPAADRRFDTDARWRGFSGWGLAVAHTFVPADGWQLQLEGQALALRRWRERHIAGRVDYSAAGALYRFGLRSTQLDDGLEFPFQAEAAARGAGLLFGAALSWQGERARARVELRDLGWLHWSRVPQQDAWLDSETAAVDADGYLIYEPLVQGVNSQAGRTKRAAPDALLSFGWQATPSAELNAAAWWLPGHAPLPRLGLRWRSGGGVVLGAEWRVHERRLGLDATWGAWRVQWGADRLGGDARSRAVALSYGLAY